MDVKKKLVELLDNFNRDLSKYAGNPKFFVVDDNSELADHLIANGVTVQDGKDTGVPTKWIPVTERLPEDNSNVIACLWIGEESRIYPAFYAHGAWWDRVFSTPTTNTTTHWQPMPKPPKGE